MSECLKDTGQVLLDRLWWWLSGVWVPAYQLRTEARHIRAWSTRQALGWVLTALLLGLLIGAWLG